MKLDGSFEVQGQWFGAASYGLYQVIPESARTAIFNLAAPQRDAVLALYDPRRSSPAALFDPAIAARLGAMVDAMAVVRAENHPVPLTKPELEPACVPADTPTTCSWERVWRRRFRVFNRGLETGEPASVNKPVYACNDIHYDACVVAAARAEFLPTK
jgi:hypothetical protein